MSLAPEKTHAPLSASQQAPAPRRASLDWIWTTSTGMVAAGASLTMLPLHGVFTDLIWFLTGLWCALPYWLVVALLRRRGNLAWAPFPGMAASALAVLWVFVPTHLGFGVLPNRASMHDLAQLLQAAGVSVRTEHAPLMSNHALRLLTTIAFVVVAILADVLAIVLRHPLLAGAPLIEVLAVSAAVASTPSSPVLFTLAAAGFLLIVLAGTRLQDTDWGPSLDGSAGRLGGARRIGIAAIAAALVIPLLFPKTSVNLLSRASHKSGNGDLGTGSSRIALSDLVSLRGSLNRSNPTELFIVQVPADAKPYYIRVAVLDRFAEDGWTSSGLHELPSQSLDEPVTLPVEAASGAVPSHEYAAEFTLTSLGGVQLPTLLWPSGFSFAPRGTWTADTATVDLRGSIKGALRYREQVVQFEPTVEQLRGAGTWLPSGSSFQNQLVEVPQEPALVTNLVRTLTEARTTDYDKAAAITNYFLSPVNGFRYSLDVPPTDGVSAIESFLTKKQGFCQQYAATAAVMMRMAGIPARVVVGFNHTPPDARGFIHVTTADAHAWVEAYFPNVGWVPFDPTPLGGPDLGRAIPLPWAPKPSAQPSQSSTSSAPNSLAPKPTESSDAPQAQSAQHRSTKGLSGTGVLALISLVALAAAALAGPNLVRRRQRRRRLANARTDGDPEALWAELAATAVDKGVLWPPTLTVGQVPVWLRRHGLETSDQTTVATVARAVELRRYSASGAATGLIEKDTVEATSEALGRWERYGRRRLRARWWPASIRQRKSASHR